MRKVFLISILGLILTASPAYAALRSNITTRTTNLASRAAMITQKQEQVSQNLRQRAQTEITRRINFLNQEIALINAMRKLSATDKSNLQAQIQMQIDGLNSLQTKINSDTDNATLRTDVNSIISNYYIFLFFRVQVNLLAASDRMSTTTDELTAIYTKLQTRINQTQAAGNDVSSVNALLSDMNAKLADAATQYQAAQAKLTPLTATGYPGNKITLEDARTMIKTGLTDIKTAYQDALQIRQQLQGFKNTNPQSSPSAI